MEATQIISLYASSAQADWVQIAGIALLAYEYIITFDQEVALFWKRKMTGATVLFLATRYMALLDYDLLGAALFARMPDQSCDTLSKTQFLMNICQYPCWAAFSSLRALALSGMNWTLAVVVFAFALGPFAMNLWPLIAHQTAGTNVLTLGCVAFSSSTAHQVLIGVAISRSSIIVADMLVVISTWLSWQRSMSSAALGATAPTLSSVLMKNGTIYFIVVIICNVLHLTFSLISINILPTNASFVIELTDPLTAILVCRFLLALRHAHQAALDRAALRTTHTLGEERTGQDTLRFASAVIGSIGESLEGQEVDDPVRDGNAEHPKEMMVDTDVSQARDAPQEALEREGTSWGHEVPAASVSGPSRTMV